MMSSAMLKKKQITDLDHTEAKAFFLKEESYFNFDLPKYFVFQKLLGEVEKKLNGKALSDFYNNTTSNGESKTAYPCDYENVNYTLLNNKDGKFAWRPFQLIHPAIYVSLVYKITEENNWKLIVEKFKEFQSNPEIKCYSIPLQSDSKESDRATAINNWWQLIEQQSIELSLNFDYVLHTDITNCYGSIYTHSIPWALHTKPTAKDNRKDNSLLGNTIDRHLRNMSYGQTNGIPQGSVLMDFIAEIVLGYADLELSKKITDAKIKDYQILRYRDDYRIFSNNPQDTELITKLLTEVLIELGIRLNAQKTILTNNVVRDSIKPDKLYWITTLKRTKNLQENLLLIHNLSTKYPNSGALDKALGKFYSRINRIKKYEQNIQVLISILIDIAYKNPRTYPIAMAILSKLLSLLEIPETQKDIFDAIKTKFNKIPNTGHIKLWLQRVTIKIDREREYDELLCEKVNNNSIKIWNSEWLNADFQKLLNETSIIDEQVIKDIDIIINKEEVQLFKSVYDSDMNESTPEFQTDTMSIEKTVECF